MRSRRVRRHHSWRIPMRKQARGQTRDLPLLQVVQLERIMHHPHLTSAGHVGEQLISGNLGWNGLRCLSGSMCEVESLSEGSPLLTDN